MGKTIGRVGKAVATGGISEYGNVGKKFGIGLDDEQGAYVTPEQKRAQEYQKFLGDYSGEMNNAEKAVQEGAFTKDLFGKDGLQSQISKEGTDLASRGYSLQPQDYEAYGQTAGDVSRLFGQQEQATSQNLARRGLMSAGSGAAGAAFSGIQGNKNEMLAQAQTNIAQKRMADTQQRLQANRNMQMNMANQGVGFQNQRYQGKGQALSGSMGVEAGMNEQNRQTLQDQQAAVKPGLLSTIGQGLQRGIGQTAQAAPGMALGAATGGAYGTASNKQTEMFKQQAKRRARDEDYE